MPLVSVIIPNYNHAAFLKQRIESVLNQTFQDFELIILDDCSTDNSKEIIEEYRSNPKVKSIVYSKMNSGSPFEQWRKGIVLAKGEYVWIAESDDWASLDFLHELISNLSKKKNVGICFCDSNWVDNDGNERKNLSIHSNDFLRNGKEEIKMHLIKYNTIQNVSATLIKTNLAKKYIGKAVQFKSSGDWCLYIDILEESNILFIGKKLNNFRWYHNNTSNNARQNGLWITEGLKIIASCQAYKLSFTKKEIAEILNYWLQKPKLFKGFLKFKLQIISVFYLTVFQLKLYSFRIRKLKAIFFGFNNYTK
jgi:glycosyltransferase involved in cell wall biosynthesis